MIDVGLKVHRWTVLSEAEKRGRRRVWLCRCDCGTEKEVYDQNLRIALRDEVGGSRSCGCLLKEVSTKHGQYTFGKLSPEYVVWLGMNKRCHSPKNPSYSNYGARGIRVCDAWRRSFVSFLSDMGPRPSSKHTLDRIDANKDYSPENCLWTTVEEQARNKRCNRYFIVSGKLYTMSDLARQMDLDVGTLWHQINNGTFPVQELAYEEAAPLIANQFYGIPDVIY